jgi:hypothetical protein
MNGLLDSLQPCNAATLLPSNPAAGDSVHLKCEVENAALILFSSAKKFFGLNGKLLVNGCGFRFGQEFLKTWIVADWVPDGIDL